MKTIERTRQAARAINIRKTFGARSAAHYLYRRGWSLSAALWLVAGGSLAANCQDVPPRFENPYYEDYYSS